MTLKHLTISPFGEDQPESLPTLDHSTAIADSLATLAGEILADPLLKRQLSDRVYQLLVEDLRQQKQRNGK
jgi:hypothetical protein